jgi:hypothetical protein
MLPHRIDRHAATVEDLRVGDRIVVVGRPGPRGNVIVARGVHVSRATATATKVALN